MARVSFREAREVWSRLVLEGIPELGDGRWRAERLDLLDVSSHYKNLLYFGRLTYCVPDSRRHRIVEIVVKVSTAESARSGFQGLETLWVAGFRAPSRNQVPRPLGIIEQQGALVMERARGQRWLDALASD